MPDLNAAMETRHPDRLPKHTVMLAVAGVVTDGDKLLLVRDTHGFWAGVGGWVDEGESPEEALIREVREELGVAAEIVRPLRPFIAWNVPRAAEPTHFILFFFEVRLASHDFTLLEAELTDVTWADRATATTLDMLPHVKACIDDRLDEWLGTT